MRVWVTRSQPGAGRMAAALTQAGHAPVVGPVFSIEQLTVEVEGATSVCVVLSGHAVSAARSLRPSLGFLAIGRATARALADATGFPVAIPESADSEGVVRWLQEHLVELKTAPVLILTGVGGREVIEAFLDSAAVAYRRVEVYRRQPRRLREIPFDIDAIEIASLDALNEVAQKWAAGHGSLDIPLLVVSTRLADAARSLGFRRVTVCAGPEPNAVVEALNSESSGSSTT